MIHYTLLPEKEIKILKREYRTRLIIFILFFMSFAVLVGILSLIPAYVFSYTQEKEALSSLEILQNNRKDNGVNDILKDISKSNEIIKKIKSNKDSVAFSKLLLRIIDHKSVGVSITSFGVSDTKKVSTSTADIVIQGKAVTREALIIFKDRLESDPFILKVELPVADLAKNKNISYSIKVSAVSNI